MSPAPNWSSFRAPRSAPVWVCLALSLDIDPDSLGLNHFFLLRAMQSGLSGPRDSDPDWLKTLCDRWARLHAALISDDPPALLNKREKPGYAAAIKFDAFLEWAQAQGWSLPDALAPSPDETPKAASTPANKRKPAVAKTAGSAKPAKSAARNSPATKTKTSKTSDAAKPQRPQQTAAKTTKPGKAKTKTRARAR